MGSSVAWCAAGAVAGAGLYFGNAAYIKATAPPPPTVVQMAGSSAFFDYPPVRLELQRHGIMLQQTPLGSQQICQDPGLIGRFDVADTGGYTTGCVEQLAAKAGKAAIMVSTGASPMVIITYTPIVELLKRIGVVTQANGLTIFNVRAYLNVFASGRTWASIPGNTSYPSQTPILLWAADPQTTDSGAMFAAIAYAAQNSGNPVTTLKPADPRVPVIRSLFRELGPLPPRTPTLIQEFLTQGMDSIPMAMEYESDYLEPRLTQEIAAHSDITVMYPNPDVIAPDNQVSWTPAGDKLAALLTAPAMQSLEESYGYRNSQDANSFVGYMASRGITVPNLNLPNTDLQFVPLPTETSLQALINAITG